MTDTYSDAFERVLDKLEKVKRNGNNARALCPAHNGDNPTALSIKRIEGSVLLYCHVGCQIEDILASLEMRKSDLYDNARGYDYHYADGAIAHRYYGNDGKKTFYQTGHIPGAQTTLYRVDKVEAAVAAGTSVYMVEGENDVHALETLGAVATTARGGVDGLTKCDLSPLYGGTVIGVVDKDAGGDKWAATLSTALWTKANLTLVRAKTGKDAADHIAAGHTLEELEAFEAPDPKPALRLVEAVDVTISRVRFLWANRIPLGAFTLIPGEEGVGKTTINTWIIANVTKGTLPGELFGQPRHVIIIAPEDHREAVVTPRLKETGADLKPVTFIDARIYGDSEHSIVIPRDLDEIARLCRKRNTALVDIDSFVTTLPETMKSISYKDIATALKALGTFAETTNVGVLAPWHLNKTSGSDTAVRMMDSRAFRTAARSILLAVGDPEKPGEVIVALDKANGASLDTPAVRFKIDTASYTVEEIDEQTGEAHYIPATCSVAKFIGEEAGNGRDLARQMLTPAMERGDDPKKWLRNYLTETGPCLRDQIMEAAKDAGFGEKKIQRAAGQLRVVYRDHTIKRPNSTPLRKVEWSLPEEDSDGEDTSPPRSSPPSITVLTVPTEDEGRVNMSLSSLVSGGEDGQDGQVDVRESVLTDETSVLTEAADPMCTRCSRPLVWPDSQQRGTCSTCWLHGEDGEP